MSRIQNVSAVDLKGSSSPNLTAEYLTVLLVGVSGPDMRICFLNVVLLISVTAFPASHRNEEHGENQNKPDFAALPEKASELGVCPCILLSCLQLSAVTDDWDENNSMSWSSSSAGKALQQSEPRAPLHCCCSGLAA